MEQLFPVFDVPSVSRLADTEKKKYKRSLKWDIASGDFVLDGANRVEAAGGRENFEIWCLKVVQTERFSCLAYPDEIGVEMEEAMKQSTHEAAESLIERTICEALLVNPKTEYVRDFTFWWKADSLSCSFTVKGKELEEFTLSTNITMS